MEAARERTARTARLVYLCAAAGVFAMYYAVPSARVAAAAALGALSLAAICYGLVRFRPPRRVGWILLALAVVLLAAGNGSFAALTEHRPAEGTYPAVADVFYLLAYPPLVIGLVLLGRPVLPSRDPGMLLDVIGLSLAGSLIVWIALVRPAVMGVNLSNFGRVVAVASWVGAVAVFVAAARIAVDWHRNLAGAVLGVGVLALVVGDILYGAALVRGELASGTSVDLGYQVFIVACGASALLPAMADEAMTDCGPRPIGHVRMVVLGLVMLVAPTALLVEATPGPVTTGVAIAIVSAALGIIAVVRLGLATRAHRRRLARDRAARETAGALVAATTREEVMSSVDLALRALLPKGADRNIQIVEQSPARAVLIAAPVDAALPHGPADGILTVPLPASAVIGTQRAAPQSPGTAMRFRAPARDLVELAPVLEAIAEQAGAALNRVALVARLRDDDRERYFRTLVLTSRDVTLISRGGRVEYATPSAGDMFGRDVIGEQLSDLVERPDSRMVVPGGGDEGRVRRPDESTLTVLARHRDLSGEPTVHGIVTTLRDVTAERDLQRDLAYRANHDPLTGLVNAEAFNRELDLAARRHHPADRTGWATLFVDLDDFKIVNDTYGHGIGDRLLEVVARRIESCLRSQDLAARIGGDEFAAVLVSLRDEAAAQVVAQRIADTLASPVVIDGIELSSQASIGLSFSSSAVPPETILREADAALYTAKAHGKGRWAQYRTGMASPARRHLDARQRIERAMTSGDLTLHYQPVVRLATDTPVGFEALIRLNDNGRAMSPPELIRIADDTGLISTLGAWIIRRALVDQTRLNADGEQGRYVSVNVSARQLRQPDFVELVRQQVADTGADPAMLVLEITEDLLVGDDYDRAWDFLAELRNDGIRIAIDDYGTGYASLSYLRQPGIDIVKIDQSFVADATTPRGRTLLGYLTDLCVDLGLGEIAEGVRDAASRDVLVELGCEWGQGFLYAPAMTVDNAAKWRPSADNRPEG